MLSWSLFTGRLRLLKQLATDMLSFQKKMRDSARRLWESSDYSFIRVGTVCLCCISLIYSKVKSDTLIFWVSENLGFLWYVDLLVG